MHLEYVMHLLLGSLILVYAWHVITYTFIGSSMIFAIRMPTRDDFTYDIETTTADCKKNTAAHEQCRMQPTKLSIPILTKDNIQQSTMIV